MTRNSLLVGAVLTAVASLNGPLVANGNDYAFKPLGTEVKEGEVTLAVRLVHTPTGNVVPDATILQTRIDAMFTECGNIHQPPAFMLVISLSAPGKLN